jgi:hypothetical protein
VRLDFISLLPVVNVLQIIIMFVVAVINNSNIIIVSFYEKNSYFNSHLILNLSDIKPRNFAVLLCL